MNISRSLLLLSLLLPGGVLPAIAGETGTGYAIDLEQYLPRLGSVQPEKELLKEEVRKFRSYPRLDRAYRLQRQGVLGEARKEFEAYFALNPEDDRARASYVMLLEQMSLHREVIAQTGIILKRSPDFVPAYFSRGEAYRKLGDLERAYQSYSTAATVKEIRREDRVYALTSAMDLAIALRDYKAAGRMLEALLQIEKTHAAYLNAGYLQERSGEFGKALEAYGNALDLARSPAEKVAAAFAVAETAKKMKLPERAGEAYLAVLESDKSNAAALRGLAQLAYDDKRYPEAEKWMLQLKGNGASAADREFLAQLYLNQQNYPAAIVELRGALAEQGKRAPVETVTALAQAYESAGNLAESAQLYQALAARNPGNGELQLRLGSLLVRMQKYQAAEPHLVKALASDLSASRKSVAHRNLALVSEQAGNFEKAAKELKLSLGNQPPTPDLLVRLAVLLNKGGKKEEALKYLDRALALPSLPEPLRRQAHQERSVIYEKSGDAAAAAAELEKALPPEGKVDAATRVRLGVLLAKGGKPDEALRHLDLALADKALAGNLKIVALREKGLLLEKTGRPLDAAQEYEKALAAGDRTPARYLALANLYGATAPAKAIGYLQQVVKAPKGSTAEKCSAEESLGMIYFQQGENAEALTHLSAALRLCGERWQLRYYAGLANYRARNWQQAVEEFQAAQAVKSDAATLLGIALCQIELGRPGAAVHYLQLALADPAPRKAEQSKQIYDTLGYLHAEEHAYDKAADAFARSLEVAPDNTVSMKLASVLDLSGNAERSWKIFSGVEPELLPAAQRVEYQELKASLLQKQGRTEEALAALEEAQKLQPTAARSHALGVLYQSAGRGDKALGSYRAAYQEEPQQDEYALSLGYAYLAERRHREAIATFEAVAARNPHAPKIKEELGYLHSRIGNNEEAARWFKAALDAPPPRETLEERERWEKDAHRLRGEISKLTKTFGAALYATYRAGHAPVQPLASGESLSGGLTGQSGLELWYRPPKVGLIDDRILELFGRVFGNLDANSLRYNDRSTQAGIGVRYKFLKSENLWISGERLIKIGADAMDDWLFRLLYSRSSGFEPRPFQASQDYYLLYGELDWYLRSDTVAAYAEARKGRAFTLRPNYLLIPHLVLDSRWQSPYNAGGNYLEGGAGISLRHFFNGTRYHNYRDLVDLTITYKHGWSFTGGFGKSAGEYDTGLISLGFFFR